MNKTNVLPPISEGERPGSVNSSNLSRPGSASKIRASKEEEFDEYDELVDPAKPAVVITKMTPSERQLSLEAKNIQDGDCVSTTETSRLVGYDGKEHSLISMATQTESSLSDESFLSKSSGRLLRKESSDQMQLSDGQESSKRITRKSSKHGTAPSLRSSRSNRSKVSSRSDRSEKSAKSQKSADGSEISVTSVSIKTPLIVPPYPEPSIDDEFGIPIFRSDDDSERKRIHHHHNHSHIRSTPHTKHLRHALSDEGSQNEPFAPTLVSKTEQRKKAAEEGLMSGLGPPSILQYHRESEHPTQNPALSAAEAAAAQVLNLDAGSVCEFCGNVVPQLPSLEDQASGPPEEQFCCAEYRNLLQFALTHPLNQVIKDEEPGNLKPSPPHVVKKAKRDPNDSADKRMRDRLIAQQLARQQAAAMAALQSTHASAPSNKSGNLLLDKTGNSSQPQVEKVSSPTLSSARNLPSGLETTSPSKLLQPSTGPSQDITNSSNSAVHFTQHHNMAAESAVPAKFLIDPPVARTDHIPEQKLARQMKTINYQLSNMKCYEEGWTLRAPSPLVEDEISPVFEIDLDGIDAMAEAMGMSPRLPPSGVINKFHVNGRKFLTLFMDGTGNVFYPSGNCAMVISRGAELGHVTYIINPDTMDPHVSPLAVLDSCGRGTFFYQNGKMRICYDQLMGVELNQNNCQRRQWMWEGGPHTHAPPFQPICFALNRHIGVRVTSRDSVLICFTASSRQCRLNAGAKLRLSNPASLDVVLNALRQDAFELEQIRHQVRITLERAGNLVRYPHHPRPEKLSMPRHLDSEGRRLEMTTRAGSKAETVGAASLQQQTTHRFSLVSGST